MCRAQGTGVLRCAQDDSKNLQQRKLAAAKTCNSKNLRRQGLAAGNLQRQEIPTTRTDNGRNRIIPTVVAKAQVIEPLFVRLKPRTARKRQPFPRKAAGLASRAG